jgi:hypothetical protein
MHANANWPVGMIASLSTLLPRPNATLSSIGNGKDDEARDNKCPYGHPFP